MYKWIDENGSVTYSNAPPADPHKARNVTTIEDISPDPGRREQALEAPPRSTGASAAPSSLGVTRAPEATAPAPPRTSVRRLRTEAVQDPCLRSPDPQCHARHRDKYDPYLGYAPSTLAPPAVGSTGGAGAGGAVGGRIAITPER